MTKPEDGAPLFAEERKEKILELLRESSKLLVPELCEWFEVSPATIRNDLRDLEKAGRLKRTHGGAIPMGKIGFEPDSHAKEVEHVEEKRRMAVFAASLVEDGDAVALDTGTTTFELAKLLVEKKRLAVVTNDVKIASYLEACSDASVFLTGGLLRRGFHCTTGASAAAQLSLFNVDKAFMAANALSVEKGFTTPSMEQAEVKRAMLATASEVIFLVDSHKLGLVSFTKFAELSDADRLITDSAAGKRTVSQLRSQSESLEITVV